MEIHLRAIGFISDEDSAHLIVKDFPAGSHKKTETADEACKRLYGDSFQLILITAECPMPEGRYIHKNVVDRIYQKK